MDLKASLKCKYLDTLNNELITEQEDDDNDPKEEETCVLGHAVIICFSSGRIYHNVQSTKNKWPEHLNDGHFMPMIYNVMG